MSDTNPATTRYRDILTELMDMAMDIARTLHAEITANPAEPAAEGAPDATLRFDRIARAIRRTVTLARSLDAPMAATATPVPDPVAARRRVIRQVEDAIASTRTGSAAAALDAELSERLDAPEFARDLLTRPVAEIIDEICADLGLLAMAGCNPYKRRTPADLASLSARARAVPPPPPGAAPSLPIPRPPTRPSPA